MTFRIPVSTQEPLQVTQEGDSYVRRVYRKQYLNVNGSVVDTFTVPSGVKIRPIMLLVETGVVQPAPANCFARVDFKTGQPDGVGNWIWSTLLPSLDNRAIWHVLSRAGGYGTYDVANAYFGWTYRMNHIPFPDIVLQPFERIIVEAQNFGAADSLTVRLSYDEYQRK
jgi:hypothetical protein